VGRYDGESDDVTFVVDEPFLLSGMSWDVTWRATGDVLVFTATQMSSREDARFFSHPAFLGGITTWMESHPWRRISPAR